MQTIIAIRPVIVVLKLLTDSPPDLLRVSAILGEETGTRTRQRARIESAQDATF